MPSGVIYSIVCNETGEVYYGSTTKTADERVYRHLCCFKSWKRGKNRCCSSFRIIERGNYTVNTVDTIDFETKKELHERERFWIENNECINRQLPTQTPEEKRNRERLYYEKKKDHIQQYKKTLFEVKCDECNEVRYITRGQIARSKQKGKSVCKKCSCIKNLELANEAKNQKINNKNNTEDNI